MRAEAQAHVDQINAALALPRRFLDWDRALRRLDELNSRVLRAVQRGGLAYISNASLRGRFALRASITNFRTTRRDLELTLEEVARAAREESDERLAEEAADVLYHLGVLLASRGRGFRDAFEALNGRRG